MTAGQAPEIAREIARARRLVAEGRAEAAVELMTDLLQAAPDDVGLLAALGAVSRSAGLLDEAERAYRATLERRPNAVGVVVGLADVLVAKGETEPAIKILSRIHRLAPQLLPAALSLGAALFAADRAPEALALYDAVLVRHPERPQVHANRAEVLARLGRYGESLAAAETAHGLDPQDPRIAVNRAFALLVEGRVEEGLAAYEARLDQRLTGAALRTGLDLPRWTDGPRPHGRILIAAEQGLGDEIRFGALSWTLARDGAALVVEAEPRLVPLLRRSLPTAEIVAYDRQRSGLKPVFGYGWLAGLASPPVAWIEAGSLPLRLGLPRPDPVAPNGYLKPDARRATEFREWLAPLRAEGARVVGVVWGSARQETARRRFYPPLAAWGPLLGQNDIRFVDLQYTESSADRTAFRERFGVEIAPVDTLDKRHDLDGGAALASALDAVVGVSSSVTALAGAVGTPVIEIMAERIWLPRAGGRDSMLGPVRFAEAAAPGDWSDAMAHAAAMLAALPSRV